MCSKRLDYIYLGVEPFEIPSESRVKVVLPVSDSILQIQSVDQFDLMTAILCQKLGHHEVAAILYSKYRKEETGIDSKEYVYFRACRYTLPTNYLRQCPCAIAGVALGEAFCRTAGSPMRVEPHHTADELRALVLKGVERPAVATADAVAARVQLSDRSVHAWVKRYNASGWPA